MTAKREVFWVEAEIIDKTMKNNSHEKPTADVKLYASPKKTGIVLISDNKFFTRVWFWFSNSFRYVFTGRVRY